MNFVEPIRDLDQLKEFEEYFKKTSERNYVMFLVGIHTSLRISDILKLRVGDLQGTHLNIVEQKTGKRKRIVLRPVLRKALADYCKGKHPNEYLFVSRKRTKSGARRPITRQAADKILKDAAKAIGYRDRIGTHSMRKTFAYHYYDQTGDVASLQKILNHRDQNTTLIYIGVEQDMIDNKILKVRY
ncbi:site-specific integrase [Ureibacillus sp. FSL W8-0352]|uniref:site-specific integrase n=1 Tax=Ureibacillus sp. FSL W8-0352 TaxID=2954596 RepID=UPI0030F9D7F6